MFPWEAEGFGTGHLSGRPEEALACRTVSITHGLFRWFWCIGISWWALCHMESVYFTFGPLFWATSRSPDRSKGQHPTAVMVGCRYTPGRV